MQFNVATLLQEPVGSTRQDVLEGERVSVPDVGYVASVSGPVRLLRTQRGILVRANLAVTPRLECSRCLMEFELPLRLNIDEEFIPERDPVSGAAMEADPDEFRIDERHHLDLSEAVRQYEAAALPLQPICREQCLGLCPTCGQNLNEQDCGHAAPEASGPWAAGLASLAERLRAEEDRGSTEA